MKGSRAWPSFYLLERDTRVVLVREGEGHAVEMERAIRGLLGLSREVALRRPADDADLSRIRSPELYFGALRPTPQEPAQSPRRGEGTYASSRAGPALNRHELDGRWLRGDEAPVLRSDRGRVRMRFSAAKLHFVAAAPDGGPVRVRSEADAPREVPIERPAFYTIVDDDTYAEQMVEMDAKSPGVALYSATFGWMQWRGVPRRASARRAARARLTPRARGRARPDRAARPGGIARPAGSGGAGWSTRPARGRGSAA